MSCALKKNLVLITALIYTIFACNYVLLCKRNIGIVNPVPCCNSLVSIQSANTTLIIKESSSQKLPVSDKFLSRPRVVTNRLALPDFSILAITFLLLFTLVVEKRQSFLFLDFFAYPNACPGIVFFGNWRI
jgi:hypothetical protein